MIVLVDATGEVVAREGDRDQVGGGIGRRWPEPCWSPAGR